MLYEASWNAGKLMFTKSSTFFAPIALEIFDRPKLPSLLTMSDENSDSGRQV
jgi:hypothetical protein